MGCFDGSPYWIGSELLIGEELSRNWNKYLVLRLGRSGLKN